MFFIELVKATRAKMKEIENKGSGITYYDLEVLSNLKSKTIKAISEDLYASRDLIEEIRKGLVVDVDKFIEKRKELIHDGIGDIEAKHFVKEEPKKSGGKEGTGLNGDMVDGLHASDFIKKEEEIKEIEKPKTAKKTTKKKTTKKKVEEK